MIFSILIFLAVLSVLVLIHELGHFLMAKRAGIGVEEFGFGLPPRIWGRKIGETVFSINALPIGGFVKLLGEDDQDGDINQDLKDRAFFAKSKLTRASVIVAGVAMNFLLAIGVFTFLYAKLGIPTKTDNVFVVGIAKNSPAETAGLKEGDKVTNFKFVISGSEVFDKLISRSDEFIQATKQANGREIEIEIERKSGEKIAIRMTPRTSPPQGEGPLGVAISQVVPKFFPWWQMPFRAGYYGVGEAFGWTRMVLSGFGKLIFELVRFGRVPQDISGPVGIFEVTREVAKTGFLNLLQLVGILSVNLAVLNIMPIPALDGGRLLFIIIEAIFGRRVVPRFERWLHTVGMVVLIALIILITARDLLRLFTGAKLY